MNERQIRVTAHLIFDTYNYITIPDINLCFKKAMLGDYGKLYSAIDGQVILLWFKQYTIERSNIAEDHSNQVHSDHKHSKIEMHPEIRQKILEMLKQKMVDVKEKSININAINPHPINPLHDKWFNEFDSIHKEQGYPMLAQFKIVLYNGLNLTIDGFLITKLKEHETK